MTGYKSSGYNLDKMELKWLWLECSGGKNEPKGNKE